MVSSIIKEKHVKIRKKEEEKKEGLEELFSHIDGVLARMEEENISLEDAFTLYQEGISLVKQCNERIDYVEQEIRILNKSGEEEKKDEF